MSERAAAAYSMAMEIKALLTEDMCPDEMHYRVGALIGGFLGGMAGGKIGSKLQVCFTAGTLVQTKDGEKKIEDIKAGDAVLSSDPEHNDASVQEHEVTRTFVRNAPTVLDIHVGDETITATPEHPFWVVGAGWTAAGELRRGSAVLTKDGVVVHVDRVERREGEFKVYNFEVADAHSYYVSSLGILVHNSCSPNGEAVINETNSGSGNFTSNHTLTADEALAAGEHFLDGSYREVGQPEVVCLGMMLQGISFGWTTAPYKAITLRMCPTYILSNMHREHPSHMLTTMFQSNEGDALLIHIGKRGRILRGDSVGQYVLVQNDAENTGGYLIHIAIDLEFRQGFDNWVENTDNLESFFKESGWEIQWLE